MLRKATLVLLLLSVLFLEVGCVDPQETPDAGASDVGTTPDIEDKTPSADVDAGNDQPPNDVSHLLPDSEQFDTGGFPNPPEEEATKRY